MPSKPKPGHDASLHVRNKPSAQALIAALNNEWQDHFQTRSQTWRTLEIESLMVAGIIGTDWALKSVFATVTATALLLILTIVGIAVTLHHREVQKIKFEHITNIERQLGLLGEDLISHYATPGKHKIATPKFIIFGHFAFLIFGLVISANRVWSVSF